MTHRGFRIRILLATFVSLWAVSAGAAPKFLETGKVYRFMPADNGDAKSMLVVETDPKSDWVRVKPVNKATDRSIWINLDTVTAVRPIQ